MKIAVIGLGYVALADALSFARHHEVVMTGPVPDRVEALNAGHYNVGHYDGPLDQMDPGLEAYLATHTLNLRATLDTRDALDQADMVFVALPLGADPDVALNELETRVAFAHEHCPGVPIVLRTAVPMGQTEALRHAHNSHNIIYVPEFLDMHAPLQSALTPDVIVVGDTGRVGQRVADLFQSSLTCEPDQVSLRLIGPAEAEAVKHFSQVALAMRVNFFNEMDSFALAHGLDARKIITAVSRDSRVGTYAHNPCIGFSGGAFDNTRQTLEESFPNVDTVFRPHASGISEARLDMLAKRVLAKTPNRVGLYRSTRGAPGTNWPFDALKSRLQDMGVAVELYDPRAQNGDVGATADLAEFKARCDVVVTQRLDPNLADIPGKLMSRDLFPVT